MGFREQCHCALRCDRRVIDRRRLAPPVQQTSSRPTSSAVQLPRHRAEAGIGTGAALMRHQLRHRPEPGPGGAGLESAAAPSPRRCRAGRGGAGIGGCAALMLKIGHPPPPPKVFLGIQAELVNLRRRSRQDPMQRRQGPKRSGPGAPAGPPPSSFSRNHGPSPLAKCTQNATRAAFFHKQSSGYRTETGIELGGRIVWEFPVPRQAR
jgi:hypothetical protein